MKPLAAIKVRRIVPGVLCGDYMGADLWIFASDQATDAGRADFAERQRQRRLQAQAQTPHANAVIQIVRKS